MDGSLNDGTVKVEADEVPSHDIAPGPSGHDPEARVRERAYRIWEEEGRPEGNDERHWHLARELLSIEDSAGEGTVSPEAGLAVAEPIAPTEGMADIPGLDDQGEDRAVPAPPAKPARRARRSA